MRLKDLREDHNLLQKDVAKVLNVAERIYSGYETETRWIPKNSLIKLAKFYNTSTDYILELTNIKTPYPYYKNNIKKDREKLHLKFYFNKENTIIVI